MGGKNAIIVDEDADLDDAVAYAIESAFGYQGQKCSAASRLILMDEIHDRLVERLVEAVKGLKIGPAEDPCRVSRGCDRPRLSAYRLVQTESEATSSSCHIK